MSRVLSKEELSRYSDCSESNKKVGNIINPNSTIKVFLLQSKYILSSSGPGSGQVRWGSGRSQPGKY